MSWLWAFLVLAMALALSLALLQVELERDPRHVEDMNRKRIHREQQEALKRFHKMQARDRNEPKYVAWWKALGIGR